MTSEMSTTTQPSATQSCLLTVGCDLMFSSKVREAAAPLGIGVQRLRDLENLKERFGQAANAPKAIIIDLSAASGLGLEALPCVLQLKAIRPEILLIGFGSHVDTGALEAGKRAGLDRVLTRSSFVEALPKIVADIANSELSRRQGQLASATGASSKTGGGHTEAGASLLTVAVFGGLIAALTYVAYHVLPFYYYYYELQNHFEQMVKVAGTESDQEIRRRLWYYIDRYELPVEHEDLIVERSGRTLKLSLSYEEVFSVEWGGEDKVLYRFPFRAYAEGSY